LLHKVLRKSIVKLLGKTKKVSVTAKNLDDFVGPPYFRNDSRLAGVGIITGLAWTSLGGTTLPIEATSIHEKGRGITLTGQLGKVMNESAQIAHSYITTNSKKFGIDPEFFLTNHVHLHVPEGATPKDGPSAGVSMASALVSLSRDLAPKKNVAMTGELTLTGEVLAVGGIREKVIAAKRTGINEIILPEPNRRDYDELPTHIRRGIKVHFASKYNDVYQVLFGTTRKRKTRKKAGR